MAMISKVDLARMLIDLESDRVERTAAIDKVEKFCEAICAFANNFPNHDAPGYLIIGANDDGSLSGLKITDRHLQNLAGIRADGNIQPQPAMVVERFSFPEGDVAVVEVKSSFLPPVRYKGRVWIRVGPRRAPANEQEERILSERRTAPTFDASPCLGSTLDDLSLSLFAAYRQGVLSNDVLDANHRTVEEQLAALRFYDLRRRCPTNAAILTFGKNPRFFLPCAYVQYLRLPGTDLTDMPLDQAEVSGDLQTVLRELDTRIRTNITTTLHSVSTLRESSVQDYPDIAVREILLNAVMHRDYQINAPIKLYWFQDKIEIISPGGFSGGVTPDTMEKVSAYRNPVIADVMKSLGYVNRFGYGVQRAQKALADNGNPKADYGETNNVVVSCVVRRRST